MMDDAKLLTNLQVVCQPSLLGGFIKRKIVGYVPPTRAGTPKGAPIGFMKNKYAATLIFMKNVSMKDTAKLTKVSYSQMRRWRVEPKFAALMDSHHKEFLKLFTQNVEIREKKQSEIDQKRNERSIDEIAKQPYPPSLNFDEFKDLSSYSDRLLIEIWEAMNKIEKKFFAKLENKTISHSSEEERDKAFSMLRQVSLVFGLLKKIATIPENERSGLKYSKTIQPILLQIDWQDIWQAIRVIKLEPALGKLAKKSFTDEDRRQVAMDLSFVINIIKEGKELPM